MELEQKARRKLKEFFRRLTLREVFHLSCYKSLNVLTAGSYLRFGRIMPYRHTLGVDNQTVEFSFLFWKHQLFMQLHISIKKKNKIESLIKLKFRENWRRINGW